jgi:hypothetical protein
LGRNIITGKYSAGCSMTQSMNDGGHGHNGLHRLFESKEFKMRQYADPASSRYAALKIFLSEHLNPASFKTYWAFMCAFEAYVMKAINPVVVKSAARKSGFESNKINITTIMSYNSEFSHLTEEKAEEVIGLISTVLVPYFREHQWIPEELYPELFTTDSGFNFTTRTGTPLNQLTTNRQRFLVDNSEQWQELLADRRAVLEAIEEEKERKRSQKEATEAAKPKKFRSCSQLGCRAIIDITSALLKKDNEGTWKKCKVKNCSTWTCPSHFDKLEEHEVFCRKCAQ